MTTAHDGLPENVTEVFGPEARAEHAYDLLTVDVPPGDWIPALETARTELACTYFDWLSAVDEPGTGFLVSAHLVSLEGRTVRRLLVRTTVPHSAPVLPTAVDVFAGAAWHERETHEMFGIDFTGHPHLAPLLLPGTFEGHPLRKDFVLAARVAKAWPGAKEPGESEHGGPKRRQMLPPGVPDPNEWGPLKGQLPAAPARPARGARTAGAAPATDRPARRARTAGEGSASQAEGVAPVRRSRSASEGSASQSAPGEVSVAPDTPGAAPARPPRRTRTASEGSASQTTPADPTFPDTPAPDAGPTSPPRPPAASDAPWHHARPAFEAPDPGPGRNPEPGPAAEEAAPDGPPDTDDPKSRNAPDDHTPDTPAGGDPA